MWLLFQQIDMAEAERQSYGDNDKADGLDVCVVVFNKRPY